MPHGKVSTHINSTQLFEHNVHMTGKFFVGQRAPASVPVMTMQCFTCWFAGGGCVTAGRARTWLAIHPHHHPQVPSWHCDDYSSRLVRDGGVCSSCPLTRWAGLSCSEHPSCPCTAAVHRQMTQSSCRTAAAHAQHSVTCAMSNDTSSSSSMSCCAVKVLPYKLIYESRHAFALG